MNNPRRLSLRARMLILLIGVTAIFLLVMGAVTTFVVTGRASNAFNADLIAAAAHGPTALADNTGGYLAVARNDVVQGIVMLVGVFAMIYAVLREDVVGGLGNMTANLTGVWEKAVAGATKAGKPAPPADFGGWIPPLKMESLSWDAFISSPLIALIALILMTSLGVWGMPQMVHKFYAIRDTKVIKPAAIMTTIFAFIISGGAFLVGGLVHLFFVPGAGGLVAPIVGAGAKAEVAYDQLIPMMLVSVLPDALLVLIMLLILSASMSTLASLVLVSASVVTVDFTKGIVKPDISAKSEVALMRLLVVAFIALSVVLAQFKIAFIVTLMSISWGAIAGAFLGPYFWSLYMKRTNPAGAWAGLIGGLAICLGLNVAYHWDAKYATLFAVLAMLGSLVVVPLVSLVTKPMPVEHLDWCYGEEAVAAPVAVGGIEPELEPETV